MSCNILICSIINLVINKIPPLWLGNTTPFCIYDHFVYIKPFLLLFINIKTLSFFLFLLIMIMLNNLFHSHSLKYFPYAFSLISYFGSSLISLNYFKLILYSMTWSKGLLLIYMFIPNFIYNFNCRLFFLQNILFSSLLNINMLYSVNGRVGCRCHARWKSYVD